MKVSFPFNVDLYLADVDFFFFSAYGSNGA